MKPTNQQIDKTALKTILLIFLSSFLFLPPAVFALDFDGALKGVTITDTSGTNTPPSAVIYHTIVSQDPLVVDFDASDSVDSDGSIVEYRWDFGDGATGIGTTVSHTFSTSGIYPVTLTVVDGAGAIALKQISITTSPQVDIAVNFQPTTAPLPDGYLMDSGAIYSVDAGYGWSQRIDSNRTRDRNNSLSPDQSYDTLIFAPPDGVWNYALENGIYTVIIVIGDPSWPDTTNSVQMEGVDLLNDATLTSEVLWFTRSASVEVTDGMLTLTFVGSYHSAKLCSVRIVSGVTN